MSTVPAALTTEIVAESNARPTPRTGLRAWRPRGPRWLRPLLHIIVVLFMIVWFTPILALFVSSIRTQSDTASSGWWNAFVNPLFTGFNYQQAMSIIDRNSLCQTLTILATDRPSPVDYDDRGLFDADDDFDLQQAA